MTPVHALVHLRMEVIRKTITGRNLLADASRYPANTMYSSKREYGKRVGEKKFNDAFWKVIVNV